MTTQRPFKMKSVLLNPTVVNYITSLPLKEARQVLEKIKALTQDPSADGKTKVSIRHMPGNNKLFRARSGHYRIFYAFNERKVNILAIRKRDKDTYKDDVDVDEDLNNDDFGDLDNDDLEDLDAGEEDLPVMLVNGSVGKDAEGPLPDGEYAPPASKDESRVLPEPITVELLNHLGVPQEYHQRLLPLKTEGELLSCPDIEDDVLLHIDQHMFDSPPKQPLSQPVSPLHAAHRLLHRAIKLRLCFRKNDTELYTNKDGRPFNILVTLRMR
jgi:mRNA-degrading endonuclease RelE of RelBE toxin-antitoxin system